MNINEVDKFRNDFFDRVIKEEKEKEQAKKIAQKHCHHTFNLRGILMENGYQERTCSKCEFSAIKSIRVWEASKYGECTIS